VAGSRKSNPKPAYDSFAASKTDEVTTLMHGERWFLDGFEVIPGPGGIMGLTCDMSRAAVALAALRAQGLNATYNHIVIRAAALALRRYPEAHKVVCGYQRVQYGSVDVGVSVAGQTSYAPVLVIPRADELSLPELVNFVMSEVPGIREREVRDLAGMRRSGWVIPFGAVRRFIMRFLNNSKWFRRRLVGTFQISCLAQVDWVVPMLFYSGCALGVGRVVDRVLVENGQPVVRPSVTLTVPFDHRSMDGKTAAVLGRTIVEILESDELVLEAKRGLSEAKREGAKVTKLPLPGAVVSAADVPTPVSVDVTAEQSAPSPVASAVAGTVS
jgi:hypothetical protein